MFSIFFILALSRRISNYCNLEQNGNSAQLETRAEEARLAGKLKLQRANVTHVCVCIPRVTHYASSFRKIDATASENKSARPVSFSSRASFLSLSSNRTNRLWTIPRTLSLLLCLCDHCACIINHLVGNFRCLALCLSKRDRYDNADVMLQSIIKHGYDALRFVYRY